MKRPVTIVCLIALSLLGSAFASKPGTSDPSSATSTSEQGHWPQWRGPFFSGVARTAAPIEFGDTKNVKWKVAIPGRGFSTPVIWGERIFLTTAVPTGKVEKTEEATTSGGDQQQGRRRGAGGGAGIGEEHKFVIMCLDRRSGKVLWERVAIVATPHEGYHRTYGSFASNAPATDGRYVYASFGSRGIYCYDLNGKPVWQKDLGVRLKMRLQFGEGAAPALDGNLLIHTYDQEGGGSFVIALDKRNGKELWRAARDERSSWSTPLVVDYKGKKQVVVSATNKVRAYNPDNGKLIWECAGLGDNVIPHPVQHGDAVLVMSGYRDPKLMSLRLGREGDLTGTDAVMWSQTRGMAYTASPVLHENKLYVLTDNGVLSCFNATTGEPYYQQKRLQQPDNFKASPVAAGGRLYLAGESGVVTVIKMGEQFEVLATNTFEDQMFVASPVVAEGELYLRSKTHLFCISDGKSS